MQILSDRRHRDDLRIGRGIDRKRSWSFIAGSRRKDNAVCAQGFEARLQEIVLRPREAHIHHFGLRGVHPFEKILAARPCP